MIISDQVRVNIKDSRSPGKKFNSPVQDMIGNPGIKNIRNLPASVKPHLKSSGKALPLNKAALVRAKVIDVNEGGGALLRLLSGSGSKGNLEGALIKASSEVPLTKGQTLYLEIFGGKENIQMKFVDNARMTSEPPRQNIPPKLLDMLVRLSGSGLGNSDSKLLLNMLKSLPQNIKTVFPELKNLENLLPDTKQPDSRLLTRDSARNLLTIMGRGSKSFPFRAGTVLKAEVMDITEKGNVVLRLLPSDSINEKAGGTIIKADSAIPLAKGQNIFLEVLGGENKIKMRIAGSAPGFSETPEQVVPARFIDMLASLSESRLSNSEFKFILNMLKSLPQNIKRAIPEFRNLEKLLLDIKQIDGKLLKASVETSGVAFETRLKLAVLNGSGSVLRNLTALQAEGDLKALLMRFKTLLKDEGVDNTLKQSGFRISDVSGTVDRFIRDIEFFQLTSRLNDMFYTFLPVLWDDLRDCEFIFKKGKGNRRGSYSCDINLDLESLGRLSISVTILNSSFYVTFFTEREDIKELIKSQRQILEGRFASQALPLKAISINHKKEIVFGKTQTQGVNVKI
ncbi:MAG TPA: flagellar hook-length control protein FliK [Nitrospirae bacterium]|nr:flagellar hook-length control protein FliK [bacterium BMS3Abin06]GBE32164.1 flagellar hook-length control protein FliK [bacterium BMS3Bbin05]HDH13291.1 flagellar hook-length control protein FliK [Nitrospirota bacterium]